MPLCHVKKFIYFHIPRCGGSSLASSFNLHSHQQLVGVLADGPRMLTLHHMPAPDLLAFGLLDDAILRAYFKFTVIREPFDRMASDYVWQQRHDRHGEFRNLGFKGYLDKAERIICEQRYYEKLHYDHFRPMVDYCIHDGKLLVDALLTLENIRQGLADLHGRLGPVQLEHLNHVRNYSELKTTQNLDRVYTLYECDKVLHENAAVIMADG